MNSFFSPGFYIQRTAEFGEITKGLSQNGIVAITGPAAIGKTVLAKLYAKQHLNLFSRVLYYRATQFSIVEPEHIGTYLPFKTDMPSLTVIDGIDEIAGEYKAQRIISRFLEAVNFGHKLILTYRNYFASIAKSFNAYEIKIKGLSDEEASMLIRKLLSSSVVEKYNVDIQRILNIVQNNPLGIVTAANLLQSEKISEKNIADKLYSKLSYDDPGLLPES